MTTLKRMPLRMARGGSDVNDFVEFIKKLGFSYEFIGKPEVLVLQRDKGRPHDFLCDLKDEEVAAIDQYLKDKEADGGLVMNIGHDEASQTKIYVTILPYKLIPAKNKVSGEKQ